jgi:hypothetical protein
VRRGTEVTRIRRPAACSSCAVAAFRGAGARLLASLTRRHDSKWKYSGKSLLVFSCRYMLSGAERQSLAAVASGFRRVHALGGVSGMPPVMTRTTALHGRLTGRAQDAIGPGAEEKPST